MVSGEHLIAEPDELSTAVLTAHTNVSIPQADSERVSKPAVGILPRHDPRLPDAIKSPMCLDPQISQITVCRDTHRRIGTWVYGHIGVACRVVVADVQVSFTFAIAVDL